MKLMLTGECDGKAIKPIEFLCDSKRAAVKEINSKKKAAKPQLDRWQEQQADYTNKMRNYIRFHGTSNPLRNKTEHRGGKLPQPKVNLFGASYDVEQFLKTEFKVSEVLPPQ
jgi:hypothetical protein